MSKKGFYAMFRTKEDLERHDRQVRREALNFMQAFTLDEVTLALGRMGFKEEHYKQFDDLLAAVDSEYKKDFKADLAVDKEMVYSRELMERELKQWTGSFYAPPEERYG